FGGRVALAARLGLWLSVVCRSARQAVARFCVALALLEVGPRLVSRWVISFDEGWFGPRRLRLVDWLTELLPPSEVWRRLWNVSDDPFRYPPWTATAYLGAALLYAAAAWLLWRVARRPLPPQPPPRGCPPAPHSSPPQRG